MMDVSEELAGYIDHTLLKPDATRADIVRLCREARENRFYSVCVNPSYVETAVAELRGSGIKVGAVVGFPLGATTTAVKAYEASEAVAAGAGEIDMVIHVGALKNGEESYVLNDIKSVVRAAEGRTVKVILETALLTVEEKTLACRLAKEAGARFVKTSTGFGPGGATIADIRLMREAVGPEMGIKAAGGIKTPEKFRRLIEAGATRIGTSAGMSIIK